MPSGDAAALPASALIAALPDGLVIVLADLEVQAQVPPELAAAAVRDVRTGDATTVLRLLDEAARQALLSAAEDVVPAPVPDVGTPLEAVLRQPSPGSIAWTATETLVLPDAEDDVVVHVLRAFVGGMADRLRRRVYAAVAAGVGETSGDRPDPAALARALRGVEPSGTHATVADLVTGHVLRLPLDAVLARDARPHRLGTVLPGSTTHRALDGGHIVVVEHNVPDLRFAELSWPAAGRAATAGAARQIAAAEAVERFACGDLAGHQLVRAAADELGDEAVDLAAFAVHSAAQLARHRELAPADGSVRRLWVSAEDQTGGRRLVPAEVVFTPYFDPASPAVVQHATTSGAAVAPTRAVAVRRALHELVERDAWMWRWLQRLPPRRLSVAQLDERTQAVVRRLEDEGLQPVLLDLTLDGPPVVAAVLPRSRPLAIGLACDEDPATSPLRALREAMGQLTTTVHGLAPPKLEDVRRPLDHHRYYATDDRVEDVAWLWSSEERSLRLAGLSLDSLLQEHPDVLTVDLMPSAPGSLAAVKVLVPSLVPITFGWGREPVASPRASTPVRHASGAWLGTSGPAMPTDAPHPFA